MAARIFISYRSADGKDKATALARELGAVFGSTQVFLDKDDLRGGSAWREEVSRTLQQRPVLLLLLTPALLGATDAQGRLRIDDADDPVRREVSVALQAGATLIPVLCDGMEQPPDARHLPEPFNRIADLTWRKLRAYDWAHDMQRLVADLQALGIQPLRATGAPPLRRWAWALPVLGLAGAAAWLGLPRPAAPPATVPATVPATGPVPAPAPAAVTAATPAPSASAAVAAAPPPAAASAPAAPAARQAAADAGLAGTWQATLWRGERTRLKLSQQGDVVVLQSEPVPVAQRADWAAYRKFWRESHATDLDFIRYRAQGRLLKAPGEPPQLDLAVQLLSSPGGEPIDSGNLSLVRRSAQQWVGKLWLNSEQAEQPAQMQRP